MSKTSNRAYLAKRIVRAEQVLANPNAPQAQQQIAARTRAGGRYLTAVLPPIPPMKRRLQTDRAGGVA